MAIKGRHWDSNLWVISRIKDSRWKEQNIKEKLWMEFFKTFRMGDFWELT